MRTAVLTLTVLLLAAPAAFAHDGGEGTIGVTNDKIVTNAGFLVVAFFPLFIFLMSLLQFSLDKRKARRKAAAKQAGSGHWPGGW